MSGADKNRRDIGYIIRPQGIGAISPGKDKAGFQEAVIDVLVDKLIQAAAEKRCDRVADVGGVGANLRLREKIAEAAGGKHMDVFIPPVSLCGDNAAMIAAVGYHYLIAGVRSDMASDVFSR